MGCNDRGHLLSSVPQDLEYCKLKTKNSEPKIIKILYFFSRTIQLVVDDPCPEKKMQVSLFDSL